MESSEERFSPPSKFFSPLPSHKSLRASARVMFANSTFVVNASSISPLSPSLSFSLLLSPLSPLSPSLSLFLTYADFVGLTISHTQAHILGSSMPFNEVQTGRTKKWAVCTSVVSICNGKSRYSKWSKLHYAIFLPFENTCIMN